MSLDKPSDVQSTFVGIFSQIKVVFPLSMKVLKKVSLVDLQGRIFNFEWTQLLFFKLIIQTRILNTF